MALILFFTTADHELVSVSVTSSTDANEKRFLMVRLFVIKLKFSGKQQFSQFLATLIGTILPVRENFNSLTGSHVQISGFNFVAGLSYLCFFYSS